jgi:hypothetical protein
MTSVTLPVFSNTSQTEIGKTSATTYYNGSIDEVRIYNRSLSAEEIQNLYELGSYHIEWNDWQDEGLMTDGVADTSTAGGNFYQFRANLNTNDTDVSPYVLNHSVTYAETPATNVAPNNPTVNLVSVDGTNRSSANLNVSGIASDPDGDNTNATIYWYKNNTLNLTTYVYNIANNTQYEHLLLFENLTYGDVWKAGVILTDGQENSSQVNSTNLTIRDGTAPQWITIPNNQIDVYDSYIGTGVQFVAQDNESGIESYFVNDSRFSINGTGYLTNNSLLPAGYFPVNVSVNNELLVR